ncbi:adenylate kinase [Shewanella yunxiaonensis]|uniref:Adenylate kinase n=1 Tax=Shewanella yunxiaonensis TaxID=2829809 RepID=A0ABX7YQZ2_9GAMM|nr:adenylate kinase [Shewanella yunxiaonensis]QUN04596.1 adenylate kinase [Shewanella yunxiaonensis]
MTQVTQLPLYALDKIQYLPGGEEISHKEYLKLHAELLKQDTWIIDGFGCMQSAWERFAAADTLIYIDLPLVWHFLWVTKRLFKGIFINPEGWSELSPILKGSINSYRVLWLCHKKLSPAYRKFVNDAASSKHVYHLTSIKTVKTFLVDTDAFY